MQIYTRSFKNGGGLFLRARGRTTGKGGKWQDEIQLWELHFSWWDNVIDEETGGPLLLPEESWEVWGVGERYHPPIPAPSLSSHVFSSRFSSQHHWGDIGYWLVSFKTSRKWWLLEGPDWIREFRPRDEGFTTGHMVMGRGKMYKRDDADRVEL